MKRAEERIFVPKLGRAMKVQRRWRQSVKACTMLLNHGVDLDLRYLLY